MALIDRYTFYTRHYYNYENVCVYLTVWVSYPMSYSHTKVISRLIYRGDYVKTSGLVPIYLTQPINWAGKLL